MDSSKQYAAKGQCAYYRAARSASDMPDDPSLAELNVNDNKKTSISSFRGSGTNQTSDEGTESEMDEYFTLVPSSKAIDRFLFVWHTSLMMVCLFLILIGILLRFHFTNIVLNSVRNHPAFAVIKRFVEFDAPPKEFFFGDLTQTLGNALIVLNSVHILCTMMYMSFQVHQNQFTLPAVCLVSGTIILMEVTVTNIYMDETSAASMAAKKQLQGKLKDIYLVGDSAAFSVTYDILALWGRCCGITEKYNFEKNLNLKFSLKMDHERRTVQYPPTCCNESLFMQAEKAFEDVKTCAITGEGTYSQGCYFVLYNWLNHYCTFYAIATIIQMLDMCIHIMLYHKLVELFDRFAFFNAPRIPADPKKRESNASTSTTKRKRHSFYHL